MDAVVVHDQADALLLHGGKTPVIANKRQFLRTQWHRERTSGRRYAFIVIDYVIYRGVEIVRDTNQGCNIRFNIVVFVFVDGLLTDGNRLSKLSLGSPCLLAKFF